MPRKTATDFAPQVMRLFDQYVHGVITRRKFLKDVGVYTAGSLTALGILEALSPRFAEAQQIRDDDAQIRTSRVAFDSPNGSGKVQGYLVYPATIKDKLPAVLVVHENRGLNPHIEDITRRVALENYIAFAPDALTPLGGYPGDEDKARELFAKLDQTKTREDFVAAVDYLKTLPDATGTVGVVGFCYGGAIANFLATRLPDLAAAVPFYGGHPKPEDVASIKAPLQLHFAELDERINAGWPAYESALKSAGIQYEAFIYPAVEHGFNNDTTPRYDEKAAKLAWGRTIGFLEQHLRPAGKRSAS